MVVLNMAFLIEGRNDAELPETILGLAQLNFIDLSKLEYVDFFQEDESESEEAEDSKKSAAGTQDDLTVPSVHPEEKEEGTSDTIISRSLSAPHFSSFRDSAPPHPSTVVPDHPLDTS